MAEDDVSLAGLPRQSQTDGKELYDEEDPEVPADLFGMWGASSIADDEEETAADEAERSADVQAVVAESEIVAGESTESAEPIIAAMPTEEPSASTDTMESTEASEPVIAGDSPQTEILADATELAGAEEPSVSDITENEPVIADEMESPAGATEQESPEPESTDITDDDLDELIDVPILPLPVESTEVTDDDLADIHAPILSPGDPITIPALTVPSTPDEQPAELSSPSLVEMVQEQDAAEALGGDLTATSTETPLDLFKQLRDLAEELPHNVYDAFKASKMSAKLDEIIAELEG